MPRNRDKIDAEELFMRADGLLLASRVIKLFNPSIGAATAPGSITCSSCAVELYLKILAQLERDEPPLRGHDLKELMQDLPRSYFLRFRKAWYASFGGKAKIDEVRRDPEWAEFPATFEDAVAGSAQAFIDWRYGDTSVPKAWYLDQITQELRNAITELKPEWEMKEGGRILLNPKTTPAQVKESGILMGMDWAALNNKPAPCAQASREG